MYPRLSRLAPTFLLPVLLATLTWITAAPAAAADRITLKAADGLTMTADVYRARQGAPWIVLAHMAGASRGEYKEVAPRLNQLGFNAVALDQRSGSRFAGVTNKTAEAARKARKPQGFTDAKPDIVAGLKWARAQAGSAPVILWGSSYSASLALVIGGETPDLVDGILSFSPGEYFPDVSVLDAARGVQAPTFIASAPSEEGQWGDIYNAIPHQGKQGFSAPGGVHGTSSLIPSRARGANAYWGAVEAFLKRYFSS